jgi:hypothetical protein
MTLSFSIHSNKLFGGIFCHNRGLRFELQGIFALGMHGGVFLIKRTKGGPERHDR